MTSITEPGEDICITIGIPESVQDFHIWSLFGEIICQFVSTVAAVFVFISPLSLKGTRMA
jgi:hypothetical protein